MIVMNKPQIFDILAGDKKTMDYLLYLAWKRKHPERWTQLRLPFTDEIQQDNERK